MGKLEIVLCIVALATILIGLWPVGITILGIEIIYLIIKSLIRFTTKTVCEEKEKARQKYNPKR